MFSSFYELVLYFTLYSFVGWVCESIWVSVGTRKLTNRGFLSGPLCPIYGFGALIILICCEPLKAWPPLVFVVAMVSASILEYFTGWLLETLFHTRWWDYSKRRFNIKGRVCLRNSILFGIMGLAVTYFADPLARRLMGLLTPAWQRGVAIAVLAVLAVDLAHTLITILGHQKRVKALRDYIQTLACYQEQYAWFDLGDLSGSISRLRTIVAADKENTEAAKILHDIDALMARRKASMHFVRAFPHLVYHEAEAEWKAIREAWEDDAKDRKAKRKRETGKEA